MYIGEEQGLEDSLHLLWSTSLQRNIITSTGVSGESLTEPLASVLLRINRKKIFVCEQERKRRTRRGKGTLHKTMDFAF